MTSNPKKRKKKSPKFIKKIKIMSKKNLCLIKQKKEKKRRKAKQSSMSQFQEIKRKKKKKKRQGLRLWGSKTWALAAGLSTTFHRQYVPGEEIIGKPRN